MSIVTAKLTSPDSRLAPAPGGAQLNRSIGQFPRQYSKLPKSSQERSWNATSQFQIEVSRQIAGGTSAAEEGVSNLKKIQHKRYASNALMDASSKSTSGYTDLSKRSNSSAFFPQSTSSQTGTSFFNQQQSSESSKQILEDFANRLKHFEVEVLQQAVREILKELNRLDAENRLLKKENAKHIKMLEIGQISFKLKDSYFQKIITTNIEIKSELDELKTQKLHLKQMELLKDMKQTPQQSQIHTINSPQRSRQVTQSNPSISITNIAVDTNGDQNHGQKWRQMKYALEQKNIISKFSEHPATETMITPVIATTPSTSTLRLKKPVQTIITSRNASPQVTPNPQSILNSSNNSRVLRLLKNPSGTSASTLSVFQQVEKKNLRLEFIQHSTDNAHYASALDVSISKLRRGGCLLIYQQQCGEESSRISIFDVFQFKIDDKEILDFFLEGKYIKFVKGHFSDESNLQKFIFNLEGQTFKYFYESVNSLLSHLNISMRLILKSKQVIKCIHNLQQKMNISEVFDALSQQTEKLLACQSASVFLLDEKSHLFWTKNPSNNQMIKVSLSECKLEVCKTKQYFIFLIQIAAFCSHVAKTCETINIMDAQLDDRFDKSIDKKHTYKTKSVLCTPIIDSKSQNKRVMGILQVVNKNEGGFFTKDDESILKLIGLLSESILKNSVFNDERAEFYNSLRFLFQYSIDAIQAKSLEQLYELSYGFLQRSLNIPGANIILKDPKTDSFFTITDGARVEYITKEGIVGKVYKNHTIRVSNNISEDTDFNRIIDIETQLPVITLPIFTSNAKMPGSVSDRNISVNSMNQFFHYDASCIGVLQVINSRGIHSLIIQSENEPKVLLTNYETLQRFNLLFAAAHSRLQ